MHGLEREYGDRITFVRANIHDRHTYPLQVQLGFSTTPEFFLLDEAGNILGHWDETVTVAGLKRAFESILAVPPKK